MKLSQINTDMMTYAHESPFKQQRYQVLAKEWAYPVQWSILPQRFPPVPATQEQASHVAFGTPRFLQTKLQSSVIQIKKKLVLFKNTLNTF